jgi:hypothetical protein
MILKTRQRAGQNDSAKVNRVFSKVNKAYSQFRDSGILFAPANGKLYFEFLKIFSVPENTCPCRGQKRFRSQRFYSNSNNNF